MLWKFEGERGDFINAIKEAILLALKEDRAEQEAELEKLLVEEEEIEITEK